MGTLYRDMSRVSPAPTLRRETASLVANAALVVVFFSVVIALFDGSRVLNASIGAVVLLALLGRWVYVARRGDVARS